MYVDHTCLQIGIQVKYSQKHQGQKGKDNKNVTERPVQKFREKIVVDHTCLQMGIQGKQS